MNTIELANATERARVLDENRKLKFHNDHIFKIVVALLHNAGGEVIINERIIGEASLLENPEVVASWVDDAATEFRIKLAKKV